MTSKLPESVFLLTSHFTKGFRLSFVGENSPLHRRHPITSVSYTHLSVTGSDEAVLDEFKQIVDNQPLERKLMALQVLRTIFAYFEKEGT